MSRRALDDPPGGVLLWMVVALELVTFAMLFGTIASLRANNAPMFAAGQAGLDGQIGLALTFALVTSGAIAAEGVHRYRAQRLQEARRFFLGAGAIGSAFVVLKVVDYARHLGEGHTLGASDFWDAYLLGTGFHFAHVVVGIGLLLGVAARVGQTRFEDEETAIVGSVLFWHMCDVAWFFLFPLFFAGA